MLSKLSSSYDILVIDIGSPKLGNIGWCHINTKTQQKHTGMHLDEALPHIEKSLKDNALIMGLEACLFVPLRPDLMLATKARKGEGRRPWSAGAGAQVLAMNIPIMTYILRKIAKISPKAHIKIAAEDFTAEQNEILIFEALVSGTDKGNTHIEDAEIMAEYCAKFAQNKTLPPSILEAEENTEFLNLAATSLLHCRLSSDIKQLHHPSPIYKPSFIGTAV